MVWAFVLAGVIAIGLPVAAWWLSRNLGPPKRVLGGPVPGDRTDRWLFDHFQLGVMDRSRVRRAVFAGKALNEPELRRAVCGLATEVLRRRHRGTWPVTALGVFNVIVGVGDLSAALVALANGQDDALDAVLIAEGILFIVFGVLMAIAGPRLQRKVAQNAAKALELNRGDMTERGGHRC